MVWKARDVHEHFRAVGTWVDWQGNTCDGFKHGAPETELTGIAVGWQARQAALEEAWAKGCNLFITHEPTFYSHLEDDATWRASAPAQRKLALLERTGMVIYRCHDVWDSFPRWGILDSWSEFLGLGQPVATARYYNLHQVPSTTVWELVRRIASRVATLGEQGVQLLGQKWWMVNRLAVGTGAITDVRRMVELGADAILATDDGIRFWRDGAWLADLEVPLIVVNHMAAEVPGLRNLVEYLRQQFPGLPVEYIGPAGSYEMFATERARESTIRMRRDDLENLPPLTLPEGYICRPMAADEAWAYLQVMNRSNYANEIGYEWFENTFAKDPDYDPSYLQIIWKGKQPVAAAGAWHREVAGERWGMVHWVGADEAERGKGLGKAVVVAVLHRLRERGFRRAFLDTQAWRMPAIATYLSLGFRPWPTETAPQALWDRILADLELWRRQAKGKQEALQANPTT